MKKIFISFLILLSLSFIDILGVYADVGELDFTVFDNEKYDLLTGVKSNDINYTITNKIKLHPSLTNDEVIFSGASFHHVLFYDLHNAYLGYANTDDTDLDLITHLDNDVIEGVGDWSVIVPENADKMALMSYNYGDTLNMIAHTNPTIDAIAWEGLTYRDIFGDSLFGSGKTNLIENGDFSNGINDWIVVNSGGSVTDSIYSFTATAQNGRIYQNHGVVTNILYVASYFKTDSNLVGIGETTTLLVAHSGSNNFEYISYLETTANGFYSIVDKRVSNWTVIEVDYSYIYDLTDLFNGHTMPNISEFEVMLDYYKLYVDTPETVTYGDIYNANLVNNGTFNTDFSSWDISIANVDDYGVREGYFYYTKKTGGSSIIMVQTEVIIPTDYYYSFDSIATQVSAHFGYAGLNSLSNGVSTVFTSYSMIYEGVHSFTSNWRIQDISTGNFTEVRVDNIRSYNLNSLFGFGLYPDITTFESHLDIAIDPMLDNYSAYHQAGVLIVLDITYNFVDITPADPDATTAIDEGLVKMGIDNPEMRVFIALVVMISAAVLIGLKTKSAAFVIITEVLLTIVFTMLGWFEFWILLVMALGLALLIIKKILGGGTNE